MTETFNSPRFKFIAAAIIIAALSRLFPHPPNFTAIGAMALFGGAMLPGVLAFAVPLAAMFIADLALEAMYGYGFHNTMLAVYAGIALAVLVGKYLISSVSVGRIAGSAIISSVLFFAITNFAVWAGSTFYPQNISGLIECYVAAIPFFGNTVTGDIFFCAVLFGGYYVASRNYPVLGKI